MKKIAFVILALAILGGCAHSGGVQVSQESLASFKEGVTTDTDVIQKLGPPTSSSVTSGGMKTLTYYSSQTNMKAATFIPVVGLFAGGTSGTSNMTTFTFDKSGILKSYSSTNSNHDVSNGTGPSK